VKVAVKELVFASVPSAAEVEAFEREAKTLAQLNHPNIPRLVRFFEEGRGVHLRFYLVQTFIEGESLLEGLERVHYDEARALRVAREVLEILRYLHGLSPRVLHRDIKPANLLQRDDALFLVDFDCARELSKGVTHQSTLVGTFGYCPPEQLGGTVSPSSDLYALGATLVHLLSRKSPSDLIGPGMRLRFEDAVNVSPRTRAFLGRLLEPDPANRFQSAEQALKALNAPEPSRTRAVAPAPVTAFPKAPSTAEGETSAGLVSVVSIAAVLALVFLFVTLLKERPSRPALTQGPVGRSHPAVMDPPTTTPAPVSTPAPVARIPVTSPAPEPPPPVQAPPPQDSESAAQLALDREFLANGLRVTVRYAERTPAVLVGKGRNRPSVPVRLSLQAHIHQDNLDAVPGNRSLAPLSWRGIDYQWQQYATLLASAPDCVRCETLKPLRARMRLSDGTVEEAVPEEPFLLIDHTERVTLDSVVELDLHFEVRPDQFPISVRLFDGQVVVLSWTR
jgi:serine/threonine protein kinase